MSKKTKKSKKITEFVRQPTWEKQSEPIHRIHFAKSFGPTDLGACGITYPVETFNLSEKFLTTNITWQTVHDFNLAPHLRTRFNTIIMLSQIINSQIENILKEHLDS